MRASQCNKREEAITVVTAGWIDEKAKQQLNRRSDGKRINCEGASSIRKKQ